MKINERLNLTTILDPLKGGFDLIKEKVALLKELRLTEDESKEAEVKVEGTRVTWNAEKDPNKEIDLSSHKELLKKAIDAYKALHEEKQDFSELEIELLTWVETLL